MNRRKMVPDPVVLLLQSIDRKTGSTVSPTRPDLTDLREERVKEFLQARSLAPKSQKAYRQDLQYFLNWTDKRWAEITPRQIAQFKAYLMRQDLETGKRSLSDATVRRILGTLKNFYGWLVRSRYVSINPQQFQIQNF